MYLCNIAKDMNESENNPLRRNKFNLAGSNRLNWYQKAASILTLHAHRNDFG
jgi:hypothetical protein